MGKKGIFFNQLNEFFDNIYVIHLRRSTDRLSYIQDKLDGLNFEIFWGVDGKELDYKELEKQGLYDPHLTKLFKKRKGRPARHLPLTRIGCALSHNSVYKDILEKGYNKALVLEDDLIIDNSNLETFRETTMELPEDWQLLYFGHWGANSDPSLLLRIQKFFLSIAAFGFQKFERLKMIDPNVIRCWFPRPYSKHLERSGVHHGTYAYGITAECAQTILNYQTPVIQEVDNAIAELCNYEWIKAFSLKERIFYPNLEMPSTINE